MRPVSWGKGVTPQLQGTQSHHLPILGLDLLLGLAAPPTSSPPAQCLALLWFHSSRLLHPNHNAIIIPMPVGKAGQPRQLQPTFVLRVSGYKAPFALASPVAFSALIHTANPSGSRMSEGRRHTVLPQPTSLKAQAPPSAQAARLPTSLFTIAPWAPSWRGQSSPNSAVLPFGLWSLSHQTQSVHASNGTLNRRRRRRGQGRACPLRQPSPHPSTTPAADFLSCIFDNLEHNQVNVKIKEKF